MECAGLKGTFPLVGIDTEGLTCCSGHGLRFDDALSAQRCDLPYRKRRMQILAEDYIHRFGSKTYSPELEGLARRGTLEDYIKQLHCTSRFRSSRKRKDSLGLRATGDEPRGFLLGHAIPPSPAWWVAIQAVWRFGLPARVIDLQRFDSEQALWLDADLKEDRTFVLCVENVYDLSEAKLSERLDRLVDLAYRSCFALWIVERNNPHLEGLSPKLLKQFHTVRLAQARRQRDLQNQPGPFAQKLSPSERLFYNPATVSRLGNLLLTTDMGS